jgi:hypothetical protein
MVDSQRRAKAAMQSSATLGPMRWIAGAALAAAKAAKCSVLVSKLDRRSRDVAVELLMA